MWPASLRKNGQGSRVAPTDSRFRDGLGTGTLSCSAWACIDASSSNRIQRNYMELKNSFRHAQFVFLWTVRYKRPQMPAASEVLRASRVHRPTKWTGRPPKAPLLLQSPWPTPVVIPCKEPARLPSRSEERAPVSCFQALLRHKSQWSLAWIPHGARIHISNNSTIIFIWSPISVDILEK